MVIKIDSICQLLPLNRITERSHACAAYTLALQVKYSTYYHLKFEEQKLWETAALYPWPLPAGYQFNFTCSAFAFRQETNERENVNRWEEKHNKHRCISAGHERSLNGLMSMKNGSIIYYGPHSPQIWAEHLWEILEWLSTTAMKTPNEIIPFERMLVEIHIVESMVNGRGAVLETHLDTLSVCYHVIKHVSELGILLTHDRFHTFIILSTFAVCAKFSFKNLI